MEILHEIGHGSQENHIIFATSCQILRLKCTKFYFERMSQYNKVAFLSHTLEHLGVTYAIHP